jgi:methionyl-tRNA formyltransferase
MKIVFMGTPQAAAVSLERLIADGHEVVAVYTQPDRPSGRGNKVTFSPVKELAVRLGLRVLQPVKIKTPGALDEFRSHNADVAVVVAYGRILPEGFLDAFRYGAVNVHFSLLPKYRRAAPVNWAIVNGEAETGVTTMKMDAGLDTGDILLQERALIGDRETAPQLMERLAVIGADLISQTLREIDKIAPVPQNDTDASFGPIMKREDGLIDWTMTATEIEQRIRGFQPFPASYTFSDVGRLTLWNADVLHEHSDAAAGTVCEAGDGRLTVACGGGTVLSVVEIQPEGKRRMPVRDFLNGSKLRAGDSLRSTAAGRTTSKTG